MICDNSISTPVIVAAGDTSSSHVVYKNELWAKINSSLWILKNLKN